MKKEMAKYRVHYTIGLLLSATADAQDSNELKSKHRRMLRPMH